jgi:DNA-binding beta-propeller fold protein YncE
MKKIVSVCSVAALAAFSALAQQGLPVTQQRTIALPGVTGKFDHFAIDLTGDRLFVAATGAHAVEVIDLKTDKVQQSIEGLGKPHGLAWASSTQTLFVADGSKAELKEYHGNPLISTGKLKLSDDADDMAFDEPRHLLFVGHGGSDTANPARIAVVDTAGFELKKNVAVASHPEALEIDPVGRRVFANIAESSEVAVLDATAEPGDGVLAHWKLTKCADNVPLAFDRKRHALYVACRTPSTLIMMDADSGKEVSSIATIGGADDLFYDEVQQRIYVTGGAGEMEVFQVTDGRSLGSLGRVHTAVGAKTALFVPSKSQLFVGIPGVDGHDAEIRVYSTAPGGIE